MGQQQSAAKPLTFEQCKALIPETADTVCGRTWSVDLWCQRAPAHSGSVGPAARDAAPHPELRDYPGARMIDNRFPYNLAPTVQHRLVVRPDVEAHQREACGGVGRPGTTSPSKPAATAPSVRARTLRSGETS